MVKKGPIILIDDDVDECEILQNALTKIGATNPLVCLASGQELIDYLRITTDKPFLIFCDINMPVLNGIELRKRIDEDEELRKKSIPFVFYTTSASPSSITAAYEMSVQGFFTKEYDTATIEKMIRAIYEYWQLCLHPNQ